MIKNKEDNSVKRVIDISGPEGNAYNLLAYAKAYSKQLDLDWKQIQSSMTSGDYENLIKVFDDNFGHVIDLER